MTKKGTFCFLPGKRKKGTREKGTDNLFLGEKVMRPLSYGLILPALLSAGCMQIGNTVRLNEDGSGYVREVVKFESKVLTLEKQLDLGFKVEDHFSDEALKKRAAAMGKNVKVKEKKIEDTPDGGKKMTVTYTFPDINDLKVCMTPIGKGWNERTFKFRHIYNNHPSFPEHKGPLKLTVFYPVERGQYGGRDIPGMSELELQKLRKLLPVFKDMVEGFRLYLKIEVYDRDKWLSYTKGMVHGCAPHYLKTGGRATLLDITEKSLLSNDDALMALLTWRQQGSEGVVRKMMDFPLYTPGYHRIFSMGWRYKQHPTWREYY